MEEKRNKALYIKFTQKELDQISKRMSQAKVKNRSGFIRKMAIDGYILILEMDDFKEFLRVVKIMSNNINQIAKQVNTTGTIYDNDIQFIKEIVVEIKREFGELLENLTSIKR